MFLVEIDYNKKMIKPFKVFDNILLLNLFTHYKNKMKKHKFMITHTIINNGYNDSCTRHSRV